MEDTQFISPSELNAFADRTIFGTILHELIRRLIIASVLDYDVCRILHDDAINQPSWDGIVETEIGYRPYIPVNRSLWEFSASRNPQKEATINFKKRTTSTGLKDRKSATFVFVTPRSRESGGWNKCSQRTWIEKRSRSGWKGIKIIDGDDLSDWISENPVTGRWLMKQMGLLKNITGFMTPAEQWEWLDQRAVKVDPPLPPKVFLIGRDQACRELQKLISGKIDRLVFAVENEEDTEDFVAAFLASLDRTAEYTLSARCLFINDIDTWLMMAQLKKHHILIAHPKIDLESSKKFWQPAVRKNGHMIIISQVGGFARGQEGVLSLNYPSASLLENAFIESGYDQGRARNLASIGALNLYALKRHLNEPGSLPLYIKWERARVLAQAGLIGKWNGENPADKKAVELILGDTYRTWIEIVRPLTLRSGTPLTQRNEHWKIILRGEAWSALGPMITNDDLNRLHDAALVVLGEYDPKFELPIEKRFAASIHGKVLKYSISLREGIADTLALLGSRSNSLSSCSRGRAEHVAAITVRELLKNADWVKWASLNEHLSLLAEAAPDEFLKSVEAALIDPINSPFKEIFGQEGSGFTGSNYISGLLWALETLAWHSNYLMRVTAILGDLAFIDPGGNWGNRPANSLIEIFLPWLPHTYAPFSNRKAAMEALLHEHPSVGWKLILSLLPKLHGTSLGTRKPSWCKFMPADWTETLSKQEYWDQITIYADMAVNTAAVDLSKLADLIDRLPDLPTPARSRVLEHLLLTPVLNLSEVDRLPLWEALVDLAAKHCKYADAQWAMPQDIVARIQEIALKLAPKSPCLVYRRLFTNRDLMLFSEKGNFEKQEQQLNLRRQEAVCEILKDKQILDILDFASQVISPEKVGHALGSLESISADAVLLPKSLEPSDKTSLAFITGYISGRFQRKNWGWVDCLVMSDWSVLQKATFFTLLPFMQDTWHRAERIIGNGASNYWQNTKVIPWGTREQLLEAVERLLKNHRPNAALSCIYRLIQDHTVFPPEVASRALLDRLTVIEQLDTPDQYITQEVIKWLQENSGTDQDKLFRIEWAYLPLFEYDSHGVPKVLQHRLASDPSFFCDLIGIVFRSDKQKTSNASLTDRDKRIAQNAYRLLSIWHIVPGTNKTGSFDKAAFLAWLEAVKKRTIESGHSKIASVQIGHVLPYAPPDPNGLWIHCSVAQALNAKDAEEMRSGFTIELFNMGGAHISFAGGRERGLSTDYQEKAEALDKHGYHLFAAALRGLSEDYKHDSEREFQEEFDEGY